MASGIASALGGAGTIVSQAEKIAKARKRAGARKDQAGGDGDAWKSSVDERLGALEQGGSVSSQSTPDIGAAPVPSDLGGAASAITSGVATDANFSPQAKAAAGEMFGSAIERAASVQPKPAAMLESPEANASAELSSLFEKPETSYSAIGG